MTDDEWAHVEALGVSRGCDRSSSARRIVQDNMAMADAIADRIPATPEEQR